MARTSPKARSKARDDITSYKMRKTYDEFKHGELHSGSKSGPVVTNRKQQVAIGLSEARKYGGNVSKKRGKH